jgi:hypothetical protein
LSSQVLNSGFWLQSADSLQFDFQGGGPIQAAFTVSELPLDNRKRKVKD